MCKQSSMNAKLLPQSYLHVHDICFATSIARVDNSVVRDNIPAQTQIKLWLSMKYSAVNSNHTNVDYVH